jgi:SAM-dependent methyltransferase
MSSSTTSPRAGWDLFVCSACKAALTVRQNSLICASGTHRFAIDDGIPEMFWPSGRNVPEVTEKVKAFYEANPFPNYDDLDSIGTLREKAQRGIFAKMLNEQIPFRCRILEVGCGTGQLTNFLGATYGREIYGTDMSMASLKLGEAFSRKNDLKDVTFGQMNLFRPCFPDSSFDLVLCTGVLHHTSDPYNGFESISKLVKPGGHILVGLYNRYGRLSTHLRRLVFRLTGGRLKFLDPMLRNKVWNRERKRIWYLDQYRNPHESAHTIGEVLAWFDKQGFDFVSSIPRADWGAMLEPGANILRQQPKGTSFEHLLSQLSLAFTGGSEGGLFIMIGKKRGANRLDPESSRTQ